MTERPTEDEKMQVFAALHPKLRVGLVIVGIATILGGILYGLIGK